MLVMKSLFRVLLCLIALCVTLASVSCIGQSVHDYSGDERFAALFADGDNASVKELKNVIIAHIEAFNAGNAEEYFSLFGMERDDLNFNIAQFQSMRVSYTLTNTIESIHTAFINEDNAQALITMTCRCVNKETGEVAYYYRTELTYTLVRDGKWTVTLQDQGQEDDLMYLETEAEAK